MVMIWWKALLPEESKDNQNKEIGNPGEEWKTEQQRQKWQSSRSQK